MQAQRTPLIGRESQIGTLRDLLLHTDERLLTLTGVGGCGKTCLAFQLASDLLPIFPQRVWLVELASIVDPALVPIAVASSLGLRETAGNTPTETLSAFLALQPALLVLDNCEHLIDACAILADDLLAACPALRVLATSRESLQITGERQYRVPPLAVPDPDRLTTENAALAARICARLDGIPLALELAATLSKLVHAL